MGFIKFDSNENVNLAQYGFKIGDVVKVTCIGGGGGTNDTTNASEGLFKGFGYGAPVHGNRQYSTGDPGQKETKTVILSSEVVPITVGAGGGNGTSGGSTSFGTYLTALGGIANNRGYYPENQAGYVTNRPGNLSNGICTATLEVIKNSCGVVYVEW